MKKMPLCVTKKGASRCDKCIAESQGCYYDKVSRTGKLPRSCGKVQAKGKEEAKVEVAAPPAKRVTRLSKKTSVGELVVCDILYLLTIFVESVQYIGLAPPSRSVIAASSSSRSEVSAEETERIEKLKIVIKEVEDEITRSKTRISVQEGIVEGLEFRLQDLYKKL
jgi:hypothetical protein